MKRGDIVAITFLDHVESGDGAKAARFVVYGRVVRIDKLAVIVASWRTPRGLVAAITTRPPTRSCVRASRGLTS